MLEIGGRLDRAVRPRRLRATPSIRALVRETRLHPRRLIAPLFVVPGEGRRERIPSLAGCERALYQTIDLSTIQPRQNHDKHQHKSIRSNHL